MPNPAITESEGYQSQFIPEEQVAKKSRADEILQNIYSTKVPEPVFDQAKADRLKRMGRINQAGRSIGVLGDILATGLGAPVKRKQPDNVSNALYQSYSDNLDKYKNDQDIHSLREYSKYLDDAKLGLSELRRQEQLDYANRKQADYMKAKELDRNLNYAKWSADYDLKKGNLELSNKKADTDAAYKNARVAIDQQKANTAAKKEEQATDKPFDAIQVKDKFGKNIKLEQGDWDQLYQDAMKDNDFTKNYFPALKAQFESVPDILLKQTARAYYEYRQNKEYSENEKAALEKRRKEIGISSSAKDDIQAAPIKQPSGKFTYKGQEVTKPMF